MREDNTRIYNIRIDANKEDANLLYELLSSLDYDIFYSEDEDTDLAVVETFTYDMEESVVLREKFLKTLELSGCFDDIPSVDIVEKFNKNWQEAWKEFFHTERVSKKIVIKPSWEDYSEVEGDVVIDIDPGMSFGTGNHPTTRICLKFMDRLAEQGSYGSFLDIGSGSGILSIAAVKLGFKCVTAYDHEDESVEISRENFKRNGVLESVDVFRADATCYVSDKKYDIVVANMLAHIVIASAESIVANLKKSSDSRLILSGCMKHQYQNMCDVFAKLGVEEVDSLVYDNWQSGIFKLAAGRASGTK
ncbi:MAG: 50S ribosomal protein L11 methyltransferase [Kiritimatiellae bacterium]|nr:50S ribosomal protein L11 methyltransferase [Kiritimatiellia bacterium]